MQFEATIILEGDDDATPAQLQAALALVMAQADRKRPDGRFNWATAAVTADVYTDNGHARRRA